MMKKYDLEEFELSKSYLFFVDSLSKANYFLEQTLDLADRVCTLSAPCSLLALELMK